MDRHQGPRDFFQQAAAFAATGLQTLTPEHADRIRTVGQPFVTIGTAPASVGLVVGGLEDALRCVYRVSGDDLPTELCATAALVIDTVLNDLKPKARASLATLLQTGAARLLVVVDLLAGRADVQVEDGGELPQRIGGFVLEPEATH